MTRWDVKIMDCAEIRLLRRSERNTVRLVCERRSGQMFVEKTLTGRHDVYAVLRDCPHPLLPKLYEVRLAEEATTVMEEYVDGPSLGAAELPEGRFLQVARELCTVLAFLHGKGIIHRDIKPSNILLARDGHIRLIDFDAARMPRDNLEQDTKLLGTRGYASPEQYGFAQTDERSDIYSLGVTLGQLLESRPYRARYLPVVHRCTNLDPDRRCQSAGQVRRDLLLCRWRRGLAAAVLLAVLLPAVMLGRLLLHPPAAVLPAPQDPHWDGETGVALWGNVPESGEDGQVRYHWRLYRNDTEQVPDPENDPWLRSGSMAGNGGRDSNFAVYDMNFSSFLEENGFYYFSVCAAGDGTVYADSPYAVSDAFLYTGADAPLLPAPEDLAWQVHSTDLGTAYYAVWGNLEDYGDQDSFNVHVFDDTGTFVVNNIWTKQKILSVGHGGIQLAAPRFSPEEGRAYRFAVEVSSSRPNEYRSVLLSLPIPESSFSSWYEP